MTVCVSRTFVHHSEETNPNTLPVDVCHVFLTFSPNMQLLQSQDEQIGAEIMKTQTDIDFRDISRRPELFYLTSESETSRSDQLADANVHNETE